MDGWPGKRLTLTVPEAARLLGISRALAYDAVRRGELPSIRVGRRIVISRVALERILEGQTVQTNAEQRVD